MTSSPSSEGVGGREEGRGRPGCAPCSCPRPPGDIPGDRRASTRACRWRAVALTREARPDPGPDEGVPCRGLSSRPDWPSGVAPGEERRDGVFTPTELPWVDCDPLGRNGEAAIAGRGSCSPSSSVARGDEAVDCSPASETSSSISSRLFSGLGSSAAAAHARPCADSRCSCLIPEASKRMFCTCRSGGTSAPLLKGRTSGRAVKPAGRPELDPSAADKAAVLEVVDDVGNSAAAEACTPSAASDSSFM